MKTIIVAAFAALLVHAGIASGQNAVATGTTSTTGTSAKSADNADIVVVTVTKNAQHETAVGSSFSKIDGNEINRTQRDNLLQVLDTTPGMNAVDAGAPGGFAEMMIRGNGPSQSLVMVDGIRVNTGINQDANPFLAFAGANMLGGIEIVRGPQSTLYGSESIGGVVSMDTKRGEGKPYVSIYGEAGSFSSFNEGITSGGELGKLAYYASYGRVDTQNDRPNNDLSIDRYAMRLDYQALENLSFRLNFNGQVGDYQEPGSIRPQDYDSNNPASHSTGESNLLSLMVNWKVLDQWTQKLTLGTYFERYTLTDPAYGGNFGDASNTIDNSANYSLDWQNVVQIAHNNRATVGLAFNEFTGDFYNKDTFFGTTEFNNKSESDWATYLQDEWEVVKNLNLTGGVRYDHYQQAGSAVTYRFTGAYLFDKTDTKIRASYGTAFKAPNLLQLFSPNSGYLGNQNLNPETSQGWDAGVDQYLLNRRVVLGATYFQNYIHDLITVVTTNPVLFTGQYQNVKNAKNDGVELSAQATLFGNWKSRLAYTWTETTVVTQFPQPRNVFSLDTSCLFFSKWTVGCGVSVVAGRTQRDFSTGGMTSLKNYATLRIYSRYDFNDHVAIFARGENLTDTSYQTTLGYPALPIAGYGGVEVKF